MINKPLTVIQTLLFLIAAALTGCDSGESSSLQTRSGFHIDTRLKYENDLFYPVKGEKPFTGEVKWHYQSGELAARIGYKDGHLVSRKSYYKNGRMMDKLKKKGDILITSIIWYPSGQMKTKYERGLVKQWYKNGRVRAIWNTDSAGVLEGKATAWYPDGTLLGIEHYKDGELDGKRILYDSTGSVKTTGFYSDGKRLAENQ